MNVIQCDRCKKIYNDFLPIFIPGHSSINLRSVSIIDRNRNSILYADLCPTCMEEVIKFIDFPQIYQICKE